MPVSNIFSPWSYLWLLWLTFSVIRQTESQRLWVYNDPFVVWDYFCTHLHAIIIILIFLTSYFQHGLVAIVSKAPCWSKNAMQISCPRSPLQRVRKLWSQQENGVIRSDTVPLLSHTDGNPRQVEENCVMIISPTGSNLIWDSVPIIGNVGKLLLILEQWHTAEGGFYSFVATYNSIGISSTSFDPRAMTQLKKGCRLWEGGHLHCVQQSFQ